MSARGGDAQVHCVHSVNSVHCTVYSVVQLLSLNFLVVMAGTRNTHVIDLSLHVAGGDAKVHCVHSVHCVHTVYSVHCTVKNSFCPWTFWWWWEQETPMKLIHLCTWPRCKSSLCTQCTLYSAYSFCPWTFWWWWEQETPMELIYLCTYGGGRGCKSSTKNAWPIPPNPYSPVPWTHRTVLLPVHIWPK